MYGFVCLLFERVTQADISGWDTSQVTDMYGMFYRASSFNVCISLDASRRNATYKHTYRCTGTRTLAML